MNNGVKNLTTFFLMALLVFGLHQKFQEEAHEKAQRLAERPLFMDELDLQFNDPLEVDTNPDEIVIAVLDTRIDSNHELLKPWTLDELDVLGHLLSKNFKETLSNTLEETDPESLVFLVPALLEELKAASKKYQEDKSDHGTHVAGIIASTLNKNINFISNPEIPIKILPIRAFWGENEFITPSLALAESIVQSVDNGAQIINISGGGYGTNYLEYAALKYAQMHNVTVIVAAGNDGMDLESHNYEERYYPCSFNLDNVICVGSINKKGSPSKFSNWGDYFIDISAPGERIVSSVPKQSVSSGVSFIWAEMDGTSMATPRVSAVAAIMKNRNPALTPKDIKELLISTSTKNRFSQNRFKGILNAKKALNQSDIRLYFEPLEVLSNPDVSK